MISLGDYIVKIAKGISGRITFLGTGPSEPITDRSGKSNRNNSSLLITYKGKKYLIDIPPDFDEKNTFDYLLITHMHKDAFFGFKKIQKRKFVFGMPPNWDKKIPDKKETWTKEDIRIDRINDFGDLKITPFEVVHDIVKKFTTFGYRITLKNGFVIVYTSDMLSIPEKSEQYFEKVDLLITDGKGWNANFPTHFGMWPFLELVREKKWDIKKIYFTQIGQSVPDHEIAQKEITNRFKDLKAYLAYDGLELSI